MTSWSLLSKAERSRGVIVLFLSWKESRLSGTLHFWSSRFVSLCFRSILIWSLSQSPSTESTLGGSMKKFQYLLWPQPIKTTWRASANRTEPFSRWIRGSKKHMRGRSEENPTLGTLNTRIWRSRTIMSLIPRKAWAGGSCKAKRPNMPMWLCRKLKSQLSLTTQKRLKVQTRFCRKSLTIVKSQDLKT